MRGGRTARIMVGVAAIVSVVAGATACSDGGSEPAAPLESAEPLGTPPPAETSAATTPARESSPSAEPTTTESTATGSASSDTSTTGPPPVTEPPDATTIATTAASTTPDPPPTTIDPIEALRLQIEADLNAGEQALLAGAATPGDPSAISELSRYFTGPSLVSVQQVYIDLVTSNRIARPNGAVNSVVQVDEIVDYTTSTATVRLCRVDAAVIVEPSDNGTDVVIDDESVRYRLVSDVIFEDGVWKLAGGERTSRESGPTSCEA